MRHRLFHTKSPKNRKVYRPPAEPRRETAAYRKAKELRSSDRWTTISKTKLSRDPICEWCRTRPATEVHHLQSVAKHPELAFNLSNLMSVDSKCHVLIEGAIKRGLDVVQMKKEMDSARN